MKWENHKFNLTIIKCKFALKGMVEKSFELKIVVSL